MPSLNISKLTTIVNNLEQSLTKYNTFIETGTLMADTVLNVHSEFDFVHTIELSEKYFNFSLTRIKNSEVTNITSHLGDSSIVIPKLIKTLKNNTCIFFLDGHWSSGDTARGEKDCPLVEECTAIDKLYLGKSLIILIDDFRLFETKVNEDWSEINTTSIKNCFKKFKIINECVYDDVLGLYLERLI